MITLIQDKDRMLVKEENHMLIVFIPTKTKGHYECDCPDDLISKNIVKFVLEQGNLGKEFIQLIYNKYGQSLAIKSIMGDLESDDRKQLTDRVRFRELVSRAEKLKIINKYNTSWRLPKDNVKYIYNYLESLK
jgi:hypothetical protein